jgi:3-hydroxyisobutyrate dehydrogenase
VKKNKPDYYNNLNQTYSKIWNLLESGLPEIVDNFKYTIEESKIGYKNFYVIEFFIESIEQLYLAAKGHRREFFRLNENTVQKKWLIP